MLPDQCFSEKAMDIFSDEEPYDSDLIDSDVEAELYSVIHHETDNSAINFENSCQSLNTLNTENATTFFDYKEFSNSNGSFVKSNQTVLNNDNNNNSTEVQIIEIEDKLSDKTVESPYNYTFFKNCFTDSHLKRKSNSDCFFLNHTQASKKLKNNEQNNSNSENNIVTAKTNDTVVLTSSDEDDDNDIICIEPINSENHIETNISQFITSNSESESADSWCFKSLNVNTSTPSSPKTKDQWFINDEDLYRSRRSSNRYHESQFMTCNRCNQKGHSSKFCSFSKGVKCFICGDNHSSFRCKSKICAKCFAFGHDIKYCPKRIDICEMCQMPGHHQRICPDLWRRFQRTTPKKSKKVWRLNQDTPFFCYNCGLPGHFGALCTGRRMNIPAFPTWPFVLNYKVQNQHKIKPVINISTEEYFITNKPQERIPKKKKNKKKVKKNLSGVADVQRISFPRTPKIGQVKPQNEKSSADKDSTSREKLLKQETRREKRLRYRQRRKTMLLQKKQQQLTKA